MRRDPAYLESGAIFAARLVEMRQRLGWTSADVARLLGTQTSTVTRWESGETVPLLPMVRRLCEAWDVSADWLLGLTDTEQRR